ncbi:acyl-CoA thioesterase [Gluconacetobacter azotocaptans]|uniref:Acyl-CoA thioesterase n=1 Tax=Gluconacetobacter azotocaptans TaxID=142834 RepID=A0A7W4JW97_9PROT|nr:acyl-CoA thioesterase [Gluconacetobacter azotocaptans]MBB2191945.1 acyl-CoA thioesterase [Gluconacetobacter azotocaptans]MBM9403748.1 acyl-CoA thioesterase [Gluconacetobacter azotocaptans]GBQ29033.1 acyl-CoA thioester hydrolase [Gluconacetobacter azotocaptans DSM 13594]
MNNEMAADGGDLTIRVVAMPNDTNPAGDIFGGWLMSQMDLAASTTAALKARGRCATVAIDGVVFHRPVAVGDEVSIYTRLLKVGRTSMTIDVQAWRRVRHTAEIQKVTQGCFVFVALDAGGRPRQVSM